MGPCDGASRRLLELLPTLELPWPPSNAIPAGPPTALRCACATAAPCFGPFPHHLSHLPNHSPQVGTISEAYPHLIFDRFTSKLGTRVASILKYLFPPPKLDSKRVITFANQVTRRLHARLLHAAPLCP